MQKSISTRPLHFEITRFYFRLQHNKKKYTTILRLERSMNGKLIIICLFWNVEIHQLKFDAIYPVIQGWFEKVGDPTHEETLSA